MNWAIELSRTYVPTKGQANLFGVIIFTDSHPYIKKMLHDPDYWRALDELSGPRWVVFAAMAVPGEWGLPQLPPDQIGFLRLVWKEPAANRDLLELFEIESTENLPVIAIFAEGDDNTIRQRVIKISNDSVEAAYESLREILTRVASALDFVSEENRRLDARAFHAVSYSLNDYQDWKVIKRGLAIWQWFRSLC